MLGISVIWAEAFLVPSSNLSNWFSQSDWFQFARLSYKTEELCVWSDCWELVWVHLIKFSEGRAFPVPSFHFLAVVLESLSCF